MSGRISEETKLEILGHRGKGRSTQEVAREFGVSGSAVWRIWTFEAKPLREKSGEARA